ncbi:MAG TPA: LacI family DNA-binding transcriptional regulator [Terracidiphilus sp.]|jgi:DNA-binding LacI/PurR family transcriptional regulator|nr:LacI family DNA-binding transcriptional regulator [Terracidiphilus sp.]
MTPGPERSKLNIRTVARQAGVSSATVSRVINGSAVVKEETAQRVRRIVQDLNFVPSPIAATLKYGRSRTYGVVIPDLTNPFYPEFLVEFEKILVESHREMLLTTIQSHEAALINSVGRMLTRQVDGVLLMASEYETKAIEPLFDRKIPIVTVDRRKVEKGTCDVSIEFEDGYRESVMHLRNLGHRHIGFIGGHNEIGTSRVRLKAFQNALNFAGLTYEPNLTRLGDYRFAGGEAAVNSLMLEKKCPTAIITANDLTAFGAMRALHARGINVPAQMSLIGFDGIQLGDAVHPRLTTAGISQKTFAEACVRALEHLKTNASRRGLLLRIPSALVVRESTAPPRRTARLSS